MIVKEALSHVENLGLPEAGVAQAGEHKLEVGDVGFVGADILGGKDVVERDSKLFLTGGKALTVDI